MKATILTDIGDNNKLVFTEVKTPKILPEHAIVKVIYCGLNHVDILIRQGKRPGLKKFPHILGSEIVGEIAEIKSQDNDFKVGDNVAIYPWTFCGSCKQCKLGNENICDEGGTIGRTEWGGYAEYVLVPVRNLIKIPNLPADKVCAVLLAGSTAFHLIERARIKDHSAVLVTGTTGGVGTIVIQLLKAKKCMIICVTSHPNKKDRLKKLGAKYVISTSNITQQIKKNYPNGIEYVIDIVGGSIWTETVKTLGKNGTIVFCSTSQEELGEIDIGAAFARQLNILGSYGGTRENLANVIKLFQKGIIDPVIDSIFPLKEAASAHQKIEDQKVFGKILLSV